MTDLIRWAALTGAAVTLLTLTPRAVTHLLGVIRDRRNGVA